MSSSSFGIPPEPESLLSRPDVHRGHIGCDDDLLLLLQLLKFLLLLLVLFRSYYYEYQYYDNKTTSSTAPCCYGYCNYGQHHHRHDYCDTLCGAAWSLSCVLAAAGGPSEFT